MSRQPPLQIPGTPNRPPLVGVRAYGVVAAASDNRVTVALMCAQVENPAVGGAVPEVVQASGKLNSSRPSKGSRLNLYMQD